MNSFQCQLPLVLRKEKQHTYGLPQNTCAQYGHAFEKKIDFSFVTSYAIKGKRLDHTVQKLKVEGQRLGNWCAGAKLIKHFECKPIYISLFSQLPSILRFQYKKKFMKLQNNNLITKKKNLLAQTERKNTPNF